MRNSLMILFIIILLVVLPHSMFIVHEGERGILLRFGKILRDNHYQTRVFFPGLHLKIPLFETVKYFDSRIQTIANQADRFVTKEKKDLIIDSYIKWCISDFSNYYLTTGGGEVTQAEILLKRKFIDRLRSELGRLNVKDIVTDSRGRLTSILIKALNEGTSKITINDSVKNFLLSSKNHTSYNDQMIQTNSMASLGIKVVDVRIKQINLPLEVSDAIYNRMRAEREAVARHHRSQGKEAAEKIRASADYIVTKTLAEAEKIARVIRGEGDATVLKLFATTFTKNSDFYFFQRSLRAYENSFNNKDLIILNPDHHFLKYMVNPTPIK
ncbi:MAG: protease modulator HflC [Candidatus Dasytiphilus stammeri]